MSYVPSGYTDHVPGASPLRMTTLTLKAFARRKVNYRGIRKNMVKHGMK